MKWFSKLRNKVILLTPTLMVYLIYIIVPIFIAIYYSFTKYSGIGKPKFYGWSNYVRLFSDKYVGIALKNTLIILVISVVLLGIASFFIAILLNQRLKFVNSAKALLFAPAIIASIIVGVIWGYILDPVTGLLNNVLSSMGLDSLALQWIGGKTLSPYSIAVVYFWQQVGYIAAIYVAGLKTISNEVIEATAIDGAGFWQRLFHVTIPMMKGTFISVGVLIITGSMKIFEVVQQLTNGGPSHYSETLVTYSYDMTFTRGQYGYGMTIAIFTFLISFLIMGGYMVLTREKKEKTKSRKRRCTV